MAPRKGRSPVAANVTQKSIEQATTALAELPEKPKTNYSLREAVKALQGTINTALERGYSHQEVAEMLGEQGIRISPASLKSYLAASTREAADTPKQKRTPRKAKADQAAPQAVEEVVAPPEPTPEPQEESTPEAAPKKARGPRTSNKAKASTPPRGKKPTGTAGRRKRTAATAS